MEREFIFLRLVKGKKKNGDNYAFLDYVKPNSFEPLRMWYSDKLAEFTNLEKKLLGKHLELKTVIGLISIDENNNVFFKDIK